MKKKSLGPLLLFGACFSLYASSVSTQLVYSIPAALGIYCGTDTVSASNLGSCGIVNMGSLNDAQLPGYFSTTSNGYYQDSVTFTTNTVGGGVSIAATGLHDNVSTKVFNLQASSLGAGTDNIPYYLTYQSCTQTNMSDARRIDPSTGAVSIPATESSIYASSGSPPCNPAVSTTPGNGAGALYFYINNGSPITTPIAASVSSTAYTDTLTLTISAT